MTWFLAMVALTCHFALDVVCDKSGPRRADLVTCHEPKEEKEMEVEGPIVDETGLDNFLRDTASERARDLRAFKCAFLTALLKRSRSSEGKMTQLSERLDPNLSVTTAEKTLEELDPTEQREKFTGMSGDPRQGNALGDAGGGIEQDSTFNAKGGGNQGWCARGLAAAVQ